VTTSAVPAAGVHLPWARVPEAVRTWATRIGGDAPPAVRNLSGGFSPGATAVLEWPGRAVFVKAVGAELNPDSPRLHRREAVISAALPRARPFPRLLDVYDDGTWVALAFEAVAGRLPRHPWDPDELRAATVALSALHDALTPNPAPSVEPAARYLGPLFGGWEELASRENVPAGLDHWAARNLGRLAELESRWPEASEGRTLVHGDIRSDNLLVTGGGVVFVDWPHAAVGTPVYDVIAWAPSVVLEGGPAPEVLLESHGPSRRADPDVVTALLAAVSGFFVAHSLRPPPSGLPTLRPFQAAQGEVALAWLRRRTGW
jgi:aminoglycoside phosphotransferase (APT) family kinase protein